MREKLFSLWGQLFRSEKNLNQSQHVEDILLSEGINVGFEWENTPQDWCGLSKDDLIQLVNKAADFFKIPHVDRPKISVVFADHHVFTYSDGEKKISVARNNPAFDYESGKFLYTDIVINRSLEVLLHLHNEAEDFLETRPQPDSYDYKIKNGIIICTLKNAWESIIWFIAEEINHATVDLKLGDENTRRKANTRYEKTFKPKLREILSPEEEIEDYSLDVFEVTAARQVTRFLAALLAETDPERAAFFRKMYELSLQNRMCVQPRTAQVLGELYIKTGFKPVLI